MPATATNIRLLASFATPAICAQLAALGIATACQYKWFHQPADGSWVLYTYAFDLDKIYQATDFAYWASLNEKPHTIDALSLADIQSVLPPFILGKEGPNSYVLTLEQFYHEIDEVTGTHLPDVFAALLIQLIKRHILKPCDINIFLGKG